MQIIKHSSLITRNISDKLTLVPTMGALHDGHLSLINLAKQYSNKIIVSIFVNPTQFGENEDFETYPRNIESDLNKLKNIGIDYVYLPLVNEIYPDGIKIQQYKTGEIGEILEGKTRPHFFDGVAQVVKRFFELLKPDIAIFGEKDFQQLTIIKKMVNDFKLDIKIIGAPIIREKDGLAMSSRNIYLNKQQRLIASELYKTLNWIKKQIKNTHQIDVSLLNAKKILLESGFNKVDYFKLCDSSTLQEINNYQTSDNSRLFCAAYLGNTRLIDNVVI